MMQLIEPEGNANVSFQIKQGEVTLWCRVVFGVCFI